jgi:hypothetical protein
MSESVKGWDVRMERSLAAADASTMTHGLQGARVAAPDEIMMEAEEAGDSLTAVDKGRQETFAALFGELFREQRKAESLGWAVWALVGMYAPHLLPRVDSRSEAARHKKKMWAAVVRPLGAVELNVVAGLLAFILRPISGYNHTEKLGKRVMVFAYIFCRSETVRRTVPSLEVMGRLWGLRATNKRSAPDAAVQRMKEEMEGYFMRTGHRAEDIMMPGQKSAESRRKYSAVQMGNNHRVRGMKKTQDL